MSDFQGATEDITIRVGCARSIVWEKPTPGQVKINVDGAWSASKKVATHVHREANWAMKDYPFEMCIVRLIGLGMNLRILVLEEDNLLGEKFGKESDDRPGLCSGGSADFAALGNDRSDRDSCLGTYLQIETLVPPFGYKIVGDRPDHNRGYIFDLV
ncbi:hypothetical protein V6N13_097465 [Hibiscus sabdariffa]|uniref:Uncharacterized protein n=1 Tax=Hibiscus sabdariffa TaxID=183260 RepID=A0ABR2PDA5_9ROSI